jgi:SPP1 gp7 family putative phage head morphogenesis protein
MIGLITTLDAPKLSRRAREREAAYFQKVRNAEVSYGIQLRKIANQTGELIKGSNIEDPAALAQLQDTLNRYSQIIRPWAHTQATRMIAEVSRRDEVAWQKHSNMISRNLRKEVQQAPIGPVIKQIHANQMMYITNIPVEAGNKIMEMAREAVITGKRYTSLVPQIQNQVAGMTVRRATLIARTETARASTALVRARAEYIGSYTYKWMSARDRDVRRMHKLLHGTIQRWDDPPIAEEQGQRHHPGEFPNCRCLAIPQVDDKAW